MTAPEKPPVLSLTADGRTILLPKPSGGPPLAMLQGADRHDIDGSVLCLLDEAAAMIRTGDLAGAALWIERALPQLDGLARLVAKKTGAA